MRVKSSKKAKTRPSHRTAITPAAAATVKTALKHHQAGEFDQAETWYRKALKMQPNYPDALHLLGFLMHNLDKNEEAVVWIQKAIAADEKQPLFFSNLGTVFGALGKPDESVQCYQKALAIQPDYLNAICNMGNALKDLGKRDEAIEWLNKALKINPDFYEGYNNLGIVLQESGRLEEAIDCYRKALAIRTDDHAAYNNLGYALQQSNDLEEAIVYYKKALEVNPLFYEAHSNLGNALLAQGNPEDALICYQNAIKINPNYQDVYNNIGNLFRETGQIEEAITHYKKALELQPNLYDAHNNLGNAYQRNNQREEAINSYREAIRIKPDGFGAHNNLGFALQAVGDMEEAVACYQRAMDLKPDSPNTHAIVLHQLQWLCDWNQFQERYDRMIALFHATQQPVNPFTFVLLPTTAAEQLRCSALHNKKTYPVQRDMAATRYYAPNPERIKIGYLSCDLQDHATSLLMAEIFEMHDHSRFEIKAYSYGQDDGKPMRQRLIAACDTFTDIYAAPHQEAAQQILEDGVHILIEMKGYTNNTRLEIAALRPAPIVVSWLGYPGTSGAPFIDYILTDAFVTPPGFESHFSEKVVRLPGCYQPNDRKRVIADRTPTRQEYGLPDEGFVFASFNKSYKITPALYDVWMRLLQGTPGSILWLWESNTTAMANLRREAEARGVDGGRIYFADYQPPAENMARYRLVDLALDPFPCTSHTTGSDALWAGCPMVTCAGEPFAARVAGSLLVNVNMPELITETPEAYETLILALANDPPRLAEVRQRLQDNLATAPLFDSLRFTRGMEKAFEAMWHRFEAKLAPDHIDVPPIETVEEPPPYRPPATKKPVVRIVHAAQTTASHHKAPQPPPPPATPDDPLAQKLAQGLELHQTNQLDEAAAVYRHILEKRPDHPEALHLLGFVFHQQGDQETAEAWINQAVKADPNQPLFWSNLGIVKAALKKREEAVACHQKALAIDPTFYNALCNLGNTLLDMDRKEEGIASYRKALELYPHLHAGYNNLGNALQGIEAWEEAIETYQKALEIKPDYVQALNNMAFALQRMGKYDEAIARCREALEIDPHYHDAYSNIGNALLAQNKADEAITLYQKAIEINPQYRDAYNNLGNALLGQGKLEEAVANYRKALEIAPDLYDAYNNLGNALQELGQLDEAIASYRQAIALKADYGGALNNLGFALLDKGELVEAIDCYKKAVELAPGDPNKHSAVLHQMLHICDWDDVQGRYDRMIAMFHASDQNVIPFVFLSLPTTPAEQRRCAELYIKERVPTPLRGKMSDTRRYAPHPERIKVGYLSSDYQNHPVAYLMAELFDLHDRNRFEITAYSYGEDDGRDMRRRLMATSDHFVDLRPLTYEDAAQRILDDGIHILIEMNGFTKGVRLQIPALHPAPIQAVWLGYAGTVGATFIDYVLSDSFVTPPGYEEAGFTEKVVRLPDCFMPNDRKRRPLDHTPTREESGLPGTGLILVNFNKTYKMNPEIFDIWMRVMKQVPDSVLWMREYNVWATENLRREAEARGVSGSRIIFAPLTATVNEHLARYRLADLAIDCFPYTSHSTGIDTLWAGCPLVTMVGETFATRVAGSLLTHLNLSDLVTDSLETYEAKILALATNPALLADVRRRVKENVATAPLFDSVRFTMGMEAAYEAMWQRFQAGEAPDHIDTPAIDIQGSAYLTRKEAAARSLAETMPTPSMASPALQPAIEEPSSQPATVDLSAYPGGAETPLFADNIVRAIRQELDAIALIDIASQLSANPLTQHLTAPLYQTWLVHNVGNPYGHAIYFNYGCILTAAKNLEAAKTVLSEAVRLNPDFFPAYINLGSVLEQLGHENDAIACWQTIIDRLPTIRHDHLSHKLSAFKQIGRVASAPPLVEDVLRQSLELDPTQRDVMQQWINVRRTQCSWPVIQPWAHITKRQIMKGFAPLSLAAYSDDPMLQLANACMYNNNEYDRPSVTYWDHHADLLANHTPGPIRVGYLSSDLREHAVGYLTAQIFGLHDRNKVEIFVYYVGHAVADHVYQRAKAAADRWFDGIKISDQELATQIMADRIEILVDLNGHTQGARPKMLAMRPAPILVNWLGYPGTMGSPYHNYIIADDFIIPEAYEIYYSEKVMRLPCYQPNDQHRALSDKPPSRKEEGLPEDQMVYSCLNGVQKFTPFMWNHWMEILKQVPDSVFWLLSEADKTRVRLKEMAEQAGVDPERLLFANRKPNFEHVPRFGLSDLGLDSFPYGSHTTASDGLWACVPILTLPGTSFASRVCGSLVTAAGLGDLVCSTPEEYVERAVYFGKNREKLLPYRKRLADQRDTCALFDTPTLVARLDTLYMQMWEAFAQGRLPRPDLSNLEIYQEIGIELDDDGLGRTTDETYRTLYHEKLVEKDRFCRIREDDRLWKGQG